MYLRLERQSMNRTIIIFSDLMIFRTNKFKITSTPWPHYSKRQVKEGERCVKLCKDIHSLEDWTIRFIPIRTIRRNEKED